MLPGSGWPGDAATAGTPIAADGEDVMAIAADAVTITDLAAAISVCRACPRLVAWREEVATTKRAAFADQAYWGRPVPGFGDPRAHLLIVGLAPAANGANRTGRMFTGDRSGDWLYAALHRLGVANQAASVAAGDGLRLSGVRITAPVHCAPPANSPTGAERHTCAPWLDRELALLPDVRAIVALGGIGWDATLSALARNGFAIPRPKPKFGHGARVDVANPGGRGLAVFGCYHVSQQNTFTGRLTEPMLDDVLGRALAI